MQLRLILRGGRAPGEIDLTGLCGPFQRHQIDLALTLALHALTDLSAGTTVKVGVVAGGRPCSTSCSVR